MKTEYNMQTKFKDIAQYYFKTNLKIQWDSEYETTHKTDFTIADYDWLINKQKGKPLLRSIDSLTKPITVKGYNDDKEFVPLDELNKVLGYTEVSIVNFTNSGLGYHINDGAPTALSFRDDVFPILSLLLQWHFNIFNLPETEYIKID